MEITPEISVRIKILRLPIIIGVVTIHSSINSVGYADKFFQAFIAGVWGGSCVAFLFIISGFLFFRNFSLSLNAYIEKLKSRFWTLLVPYLFWNLALLGIILIFLEIPITSSLVQGGYKAYIGDYKLANFIDCLTGSKSGYPIALPLWYIRDLMVMVILSPVFLLIARKIPYIGLALFAAPWLVHLKLGFISIQWLGPVFFYLGCLIAIKNFDLTWIDRRKSLILGLYLAMTFVLTIMELSEVQALQHPLQCCTRVVGTMAIWSASDLVGGTLKKLCLNLANLAFFVYATHEPIARFLKKIFERLSKDSDSITVMVCYLLLFTIATLATLAAGRLLQRYTPKFFQVITGSRG